ncbi:MAG TPA: ABC transporter ATP-binding protein, partial [Candidatus Nanopelagicales bacterium]|nr:ABC transporter ATP-binding protein [Candidatus Nanopelagicales bacterium]
GESVGLVGANGHGKSTLLKLIAGVLVPDTGRVKVRGGVAPMIELTGGFEGKLTARENIYLAGGLHGLSRSQIDDRFEEIVDFSEVGEFLDTPFRHFSSGMKVRLGFAVITTLDEPVVLVDEVLAVGDRRFRQKCYRRLDTMLGEGRTLFMVSHGEADLRRFCSRGLYMRHGEVIVDAAIDDAIKAYNEDQDRL